MFSIIIPLYNKALYIEKAMRSVLNQSFRNFEVIIVNDGSTDNSLQVVEAFLQLQYRNGNNSLLEHVRIINQPNGGVSNARNNGVKIAQYDYIAFLDADDWWHKHYLSSMKELIESHPKAKLYASSYYQVKNGRQHTAAIGVHKQFTSGYVDYFNVYAETLCMPVWTGATIIKKEAFEEMNGFPQQLKLGEDFILWANVALKYKVAFCNKPLAYYNHDVDSEQRAVGRLFPTEQHYIFNLGTLETRSANHTDLKLLLDNMRVYVLLPYYLNDSTRNKTRDELKKVDWKNQPLKERIRYKIPVVLAKIQSRFMQVGSQIKRHLP
jgi:glycosyltransferase involved in cell wall biosynthesis